ncbi:hypothetical protein OF83DRAFT_533229 [Amylostereum chailletii]|nr:hypothetical protein OF83DRAFT_533229 [Amylostereum chailletii]
MHSLPVELQLNIFEHAIVTTKYMHNPDVLEVLPDPEYPYPFCPRNNLAWLLLALLDTLPTRRALPLVCRTFHTLATPFLYQGLILRKPSSIASISKSLNPHNLSHVRHLILDLSSSFSISASHDLLALFTALPAVHIFSIYCHRGARARRLRRPAPPASCRRPRNGPRPRPVLAEPRSPRSDILERLHSYPTASRYTYPAPLPLHPRPEILHPPAGCPAHTGPRHAEQRNRFCLPP